jgi:heme/copper-type cytochrome/quinol oxidase subunit 3
MIDASEARKAVMIVFLSTELLQYHIFLDNFTSERLSHNGKPPERRNKGYTLTLSGQLPRTQPGRSLY